MRGREIELIHAGSSALRLKAMNINGQYKSDITFPSDNTTTKKRNVERNGGGGLKIWISGEKKRRGKGVKRAAAGNGT